MSRARAMLAMLAVLAVASAAADAAGDGRLVVGSKAFPESWILGEALVLLAREEGAAPVEHRRNLGGTEIVLAAVQSGAADVYPEYTGTIAEVILKDPSRPSLAAMRTRLQTLGLAVSDPLGFNDSYALAVTRAVAAARGIERLSDLAAHPDLRLGLTHEFLGRADGYPGLARHYGLAMRDVRGIQHELAYEAIASGKVDVIDIYTTDAQIQHLDLKILADDRNFFPRYDAVWLYRLDLPERNPAALRAMQRLLGRIDETAMIAANARVVIAQEPYAAAAESLRAAGGASRSAAARGRGDMASGLATISRNTAQHLKLVAISLAAAVLAGVPLGILAARSRFLAGLVLAGAGVVQTIPSLALLAILIPVLGIGVWPALVALFLYSLLPIVRNTYVGLTTIPPPLVEAGEALGLSPRARLLRLHLPMASPAIMAGIKTSAVINVGTATLAALIGAGGLGEPILSGIQLRRHDLILEGALPAALLALLVQWGFGLVDRLAVPRGLRIPTARP